MKLSTSLLPSSYYLFSSSYIFALSSNFCLILVHATANSMSYSLERACFEVSKSSLSLLKFSGSKSNLELEGIH